MAQPIKLVIDTDPGVDDAISILMALAVPEVEVVGLEQATPHLMPGTHILAAIVDAALPKLYFFRLHQLNKFPLSSR